MRNEGRDSDVNIPVSVRDTGFLFGCGDSVSDMESVDVR